MILLRTITLAFLLSIIPFSHSVSAETKTAVAPPKNNKIPLDDVRRFSTAINTIKNYYVEPITDKKLFDNALRGMLSGLDPHSSFLDAEDLRDLQDITTGEFGGLGIEVMMDDGFIKVVSPLDDTPAQRAGIKPNDMIIRIDKEPIKGMSLRDAVKKMRGKKGSPVTLTILRKGETAPLTFRLTREIIVVKSVKHQILDKQYGYVRISSFQGTTGTDLIKTIAELNKDPAKLKGLILDLRNNPGGLLDTAVEVANTFLNSAQLGFDHLIVYTKGRLPGSQYQARANSSDMLHGLPMVILINEGSASGSEIVAGALQDYKRAVIMGMPSFGKGSVQTILPLDNDSAIKLTTALYYTPAGRSIQAKGIHPDITVRELKIPVASKDKEKIELLKEADLQRHLHNGNGKQEGHDEPESLNLMPMEEPSPAESRHHLPSPKTDYQLQEALNVLKGLTALKAN